MNRSPRSAARFVAVVLSIGFVTVDPFADISILERPATSLLVIMKEGRLIENRLTEVPRTR